MTEPPACLASLPVSKRRVAWPNWSSRVIIKSALCEVRVQALVARCSLFADVEALDQVRVPLRVFGFEVIEQPPAPADEHQEPAAGVMILRVRLEVLGQVVDALAENSDLDLRGPRVGLVCFVTANEFGLAIFGQRHAASSTNGPEPRIWLGNRDT